MTTEHVCFHSAVFPAHTLPTHTNKRVSWYVCVVHVCATHINIPTFLHTQSNQDFKGRSAPQVYTPILVGKSSLRLWLLVVVNSELSILESRKLQPLLPSYCPDLLLWLLPLNISVTVSVVYPQPPGLSFPAWSWKMLSSSPHLCLLPPPLTCCTSTSQLLPSFSVFLEFWSHQCSLVCHFSSRWNHTLQKVSYAVLLRSHCFLWFAISILVSVKIPVPWAFLPPLPLVLQFTLVRVAYDVRFVFTISSPVGCILAEQWLLYDSSLCAHGLQMAELLHTASFSGVRLFQAPQSKVPLGL